MKEIKSFNSYDKEKFIIGKTYWTFYTFPSNNYNNFSQYVKVFETKVLKETTFSKPTNKKFEFDLSKIKLSSTMQNNLPMYLNGYGMASCNFYETEEDAKLAHDLHIIDFCKGLNGSDTERLKNKMYNVSLFPVSKKETEAINWYNALTKKEKNYIIWLKNNYTNF